MKKFNNYLFVLGLIGFIGLFLSCNKPFEGVTAIVSNSYIKQRISVQVTDANPKATNPYPENPSITLSGDAVKKGLIYTGDGEPLTETPGNAKLVSNAITLAIKPNTTISDATPLKFKIEASAAGFITNSQDVIVRSSDSLQYVQVKLLKPTALPTGVTNVAAQDISVVNGTSSSPFVVKVTSAEPIPGGGTVTQTQVQATFPAATIFKDKLGAAINKSNLAINISNFNSSSQDAVESIGAGINNVITSTDPDPQSLLLAGAMKITATLGGTDVKSFSNPVPFEAFVDAQVFNPDTQANVKEGDTVPVWSKDEGSDLWVAEPSLTIVKDPNTGRLKANVPVTHLSWWCFGWRRPFCTPLLIIYNSSDFRNKVITAEANASEGNQFLLGKTQSMGKSGLILMNLPRVNYTIKVWENRGTSSQRLISTVNLKSCSATLTINDNPPANTNPSLYFDLQTSCKDGVFRYTGPIDYKLSSDSKWQAFTPSAGGTLTTTLLEWNKTYDFRIIYKGTEFRRSRQVLQSEFRQSGANWNFWGKDAAVKQTFFNAPTNCQ